MPFQVHRALMLISLCVTIIGFILIFVGLMSFVDTTGVSIVSMPCCDCIILPPPTLTQTNRLPLAHAVIGIVIVALQITNVSP